MKKILLSAALISAFTISSKAQGLKNIASGSIITGTSTYNANIECSYSDNSGNFFLAGASKAGTADYDVFTPGTSYGTSGLYFYFNKYDAAGVLQFSKLLTTTSTSTNTYFGVRGVVTDATGNIYITGTFDATVDFDPSGVTADLSSATGRTFIAKYDSNGNYLWARNFGAVTSSNGNNILPEDIAINPTSGKIFIAGWYISGSVNGTYVDFDPSTTNTATIGYSSAKCGFFAAYNPADGSYVANSMWGAISTAPTVANVEVKSIQIDNANNIYAVGVFQNTFTTTGGLTFTNTTPTGFLVKKPTTTAGNATDATGTTFGIRINDIDLDASNNVYIGGEYITNAGMVAKYNSSLVQSWAKYPTGVINSLSLNSSNQIFAVGNDYSDNFVQLYSSTGATTSFGASGLHIPISSGYQQQFIKEVQVVGSNVLIGGDFYTTNTSWANQDIGYNNETILVNNPTNSKNQFWGVYSPDFIGPIATITTTAPDPTTVTPIPITITFDEEPYLFDETAFGTTNANISNLVQTGTLTYTADLVPITLGSVECEIFGATFYDNQNNPNQGSNYFSIMYNAADVTPPTVVISSTSSDPTNVFPIPVTFTFSETVTGFTLADISVGNGTPSNFAGSGSVYTVDVTPTAQGNVTVNVLANVCVDGASNQNTASNTLTRTFDSANPGVVISSTSTDPTNVFPIPVTFTFSETVTGFTLADISVGNGTPSNFAGSGSVYTVDVTPTAQGNVTVNVLANVCVDGASNQNTTSNTLTRTFDNVNPTVTITTTASDPTIISPIPVTFTFSETVTGFDITDLIVGNGTPSNFSGSGSVYTVDVTPSSAGTVTVDITGSTCFDNATNPNTLAIQFSIVYQTTGIASIFDSNAINIFPNPSNEKITIKLQQKGLLEIYNLLGEKVLEKIVDSNETTQELSFTNAGTYICKFSSDKETNYLKFIITK